MARKSLTVVEKKARKTQRGPTLKIYIHGIFQWREKSIHGKKMDSYRFDGVNDLLASAPLLVLRGSFSC